MAPKRAATTSDTAKPINEVNNKDTALTFEVARLENDLASSQPSLDEVTRAHDTSLKEMSDRCTSWKNKHDDLLKLYNEAFITSGEWSEKYYTIEKELAEVRKHRNDLQNAVPDAATQRDQALSSLQAMQSDPNNIASHTTALATQQSELEKKQQELEDKQSVLQQHQAKLVTDQAYLKAQQDFHEEAARKLDSQKMVVIKREALVAEKEKQHARESVSLDIAKKAHKSRVEEFDLKQKSLVEDAEKLRSEINDLNATVDSLQRNEELAQNAQKDCEEKHEDLSAKHARALQSILEKIDELNKLRTQVEDLQGQLREARESAQQATSQHRRTIDMSQASHGEAVHALNVKHANEVRVLNSQIKALNAEVATMTKQETIITQDTLDLIKSLRERDDTISDHVKDIERLQEELKNNNKRVINLERKEQDLHEHNERQQAERTSMESTITELQGELGATLYHLENIIGGPAIYCDQQKLRGAATTLPTTTLEDDFTKDYHLYTQDFSTDWSLSMVSEHELLPYNHQSFSQLTTRLYLSVGVSHEHRAIQAMLEVMLQKPDRQTSEGTVREDTAMFAARVMELIIRVSKVHNYAWHNFHSRRQEWGGKACPNTKWAKYMLLRAHLSWLHLWTGAVKDHNATGSVVSLSHIWMSNSGVPSIDTDIQAWSVSELKSVEEKVPVGSFRSPRTLFANRIDSSAKLYAIVDASARWIVVYPDDEGEVDGDGLNTLPRRCRINGELNDVPDFELPNHDMVFVAREMWALSIRSHRLWLERNAAKKKRSQGTQ